MPAAGVVGPNDKPISFQVCVTPRKELTIKDEPILHCRVIEPRRQSVTVNSSAATSVTSLGDAIANIPIRVSCHSSYSRHVVLFFSTYFSLFVPVCVCWTLLRVSSPALGSLTAAWVRCCTTNFTGSTSLTGCSLSWQWQFTGVWTAAYRTTSPTPATVCDRTEEVGSSALVCLVPDERLGCLGGKMPMLMKATTMKTAF